MCYWKCLKIILFLLFCLLNDTLSLKFEVLMNSSWIAQFCICTGFLLLIREKSNYIIVNWSVQNIWEYFHTMVSKRNLKREILFCRIAVDLLENPSWCFLSWWCWRCVEIYFENVIELKQSELGIYFSSPKLKGPMNCHSFWQLRLFWMLHFLLSMKK